MRRSVPICVRICQFPSSVLVAIIKDKHGHISDVNNYRGISVSSVISKVLELDLLDRIGTFLTMDDQQFGFKRKNSCDDCSFVFKSAVDYYLTRGNSAMVGYASDLSKAFDRVPYYRLFMKLLTVGAPVYFVRLLCLVLIANDAG